MKLSSKIGKTKVEEECNEQSKPVVMKTVAHPGMATE